MLRVVDEDSDRRSLDADPETILKSQWVARAAPRAARIVSEYVEKIEQDDDRDRDADQPGEDASHGKTPYGLVAALTPGRACRFPGRLHLERKPAA